MSKTKRTRYSGEFKAKVEQEALKEDTTIADIAARFSVHPNQVSDWKKQTIKGLAEFFRGNPERINFMMPSRRIQVEHYLALLKLEGEIRNGKL